MRILHEPLDAISADDICQLCSDAVSEGTEIELKADLPCKDGRLQDPWHSGQSFGEYARNQIAEEVVAFANTLGGVVCVGIAETQDHPKRAATPNPIPRVHDLARRLRQAVYDVIDPPLPMLEAVGVELIPNASGIVVIRVPQSRRRPHRHAVSKEVFVRRADETVRVSMREVQELTIQSMAEASRVETAIERRRERFLNATHTWLQPRDNVTWGGGLHILGIPTTSVDLIRVVGRPEITPGQPRVYVRFPELPSPHECVWPRSQALRWRSGLRSITAEAVIDAHPSLRGTREINYSLETNGIREWSFKFRCSERYPAVYAGWLAGALGLMFAWIERIRDAASISSEYAVAVALPIIGKPVTLEAYGATSFTSGLGGELPTGDHLFPIMSVGSKEEFPRHLARFDEDLWNLAGHDANGSPADFSVNF